MIDILRLHPRAPRPLAAVFLVLALSLGLVAAPALPGRDTAQAETTEALLDTVQHAGVLYFWNVANPANGLIKDRDTPGSVSSIASTGFGLSALCIGVDRGWLSNGGHLPTLHPLSPRSAHERQDRGGAARRSGPAVVRSSRSGTDPGRDGFGGNSGGSDEPVEWPRTG